MAKCEDCIYYDLDNDGEVICLRGRYTQEQQKLYGRGACNEQEKGEENERS